MFYTMSALWGLALGAFIANLLAVTYNFCDIARLKVLIGLNMMTQGAGSLAGVSLIGKFKNMLKSAVFYS